MRLVNYIIEVRNPSLGFWETAKIVEPHWKITEHTVVHHFLFWRRETLRKEFHNEIESLRKCRERAMLWAFENSKEPNVSVRVRKTFLYKDGYQRILPVWENGEWKDC